METALILGLLGGAAHQIISHDLIEFNKPDRSITVRYSSPPKPIDKFASVDWSKIPTAAINNKGTTGSVNWVFIN